ncbi:MAG: hypothetical protein C0598_10685, partial [Marinilabiliales bacterium]
MSLLTKINIVLFVLTTFYVNAQDVDPYMILDSAQYKIKNVESYTADAIIDIDVDFLRMEPKEAKVSYKYPNKLDIDSKGFMMIPKYGFRPFMKTVNSEDNQAVFTGHETINDNDCYIITLLPKANGKLVMLKLWVRTSDYLIQRSETFTRRNGNFLIDFEYENEILPSKMIFHFETKGINMPWKIMGNSIEVDKSKLNDEELETGKVTISFS